MTEKSESSDASTQTLLMPIDASLRLNIYLVAVIDRLQLATSCIYGAVEQIKLIMQLVEKKD